jgi:hypothetical protein
MERFERGTPGKEPLWQIVLTFPLSLGLLAAGVGFLIHALFIEKPPGTIVVNPGFSVIMMVAGGFGLYAGCRSVFRRLFPAPTPPSPAPAPPLPSGSGRAPHPPDRGPDGPGSSGCQEPK